MSHSLQGQLYGLGCILQNAWQHLTLLKTGFFSASVTWQGQRSYLIRYSGYFNVVVDTPNNQPAVHRKTCFLPWCLASIKQSQKDMFSSFKNNSMCSPSLRSGATQARHHRNWYLTNEQNTKINHLHCSYLDWHQLDASRGSLTGLLFSVMVLADTSVTAPRKCSVLCRFFLWIKVSEKSFI